MRKIKLPIILLLILTITVSGALVVFALDLQYGEPDARDDGHCCLNCAEYNTFEYLFDWEDYSEILAQSRLYMLVHQDVEPVDLKLAILQRLVDDNIVSSFAVEASLRGSAKNEQILISFIENNVDVDFFGDARQLTCCPSMNIRNGRVDTLCRHNAGSNGRCVRHCRHTNRGCISCGAQWPSLFDPGAGCNRIRGACIGTFDCGSTQCNH